jgi:hypothetical protein
MLPNPENFEDIVVTRLGSAPLGKRDRRKWVVAGIRTYEQEGFVGPFTEYFTIKGDFINPIVAEYWMKQYLEMYVSVTYFENVHFHDDLYEPLDSNNENG